MTPLLAAALQVLGPMELSDSDRETPEDVASGLRGAKGDNTRRTSTSSWGKPQEEADAATPQAVALCLDHLAAVGRSITSIDQARAASPNFMPPPACRRAIIPPDNRWWPRPSGVGATGPRRPRRTWDTAA